MIMCPKEGQNISTDTLIISIMIYLMMIHASSHL